MLLFTYLFLLILFGIFSFTSYKIIVFFLKTRKKIQNKEHYPIVLAMTLISIPMAVKYFSFDTFLVSIVNKFEFVTLPLPKNDAYTVFFYFVYILAMLGLSYIFYKFKNNKVEEIIPYVPHKEIEFPTDEIIISPIFYERIKKLFELKYIINSLILKYDSKENILLGEYAEAIHGYRFIIYCDNKSVEVSKREQDDIFMKLEEINEKYSTEKTKFYEVKYLYFIEKGNFEENHSKLQCYTEDSYINTMIDFTNYLRKQMELFGDTKADIGGHTLEDSFILPFYNEGQEDLAQYLDNWIEEDSYKHITILADYGMGKTTFLKYYAKYLSNKILNGEDFVRYPIFISLTNTSPMSNDGIGTKIESFVSKELGVNYALFEQLVHLGKIVFILDGFDEMGFIGTEQTRFKQFSSIWKLATKNNKILISGRPSYLPTDFERENVLNIVDKSKQDIQIRPFTEVIKLDYFNINQIEKTLNIYYQDEMEAKQYMEYIHKNQSILDLCKRPSMLHMTMFILPELYKDNPTSRVTSSMIMAKYIEYWIGRQEKKKINGFFKDNDNYKQKFIINFFTKLAGKMYEDQTLIVLKTILDSLIDDEIKKLKLDIISNENNLEGFKNEIYTGYFIEIDINKDAHFKFVHKSIFEYFVSLEIINIIKEENFDHKLFRFNWSSEIIDFIDESMEDSVDKNDKYPALIMIRDSWLDRVLLIPFTKIITIDRVNKFLLLHLLASLPLLVLLVLSQAVSQFKVSVIIMLIIGVVGARVVVFFINRLSFITKSYYLDFIKRRTKITNSQLKYFFDFNFRFVMNIQFNNFTFNQLTIRNFTFSNSMVNEVSFKQSFLKRLIFNNCQVDNIDFNSSTIQRLIFEQTTLNHVSFENAIFKPWNRKKSIYFYYLDKLLLFPLRLNSMKSYQQKKEIFGNKSLLVFKDMKIENFDDYTIEQIQKFIKNNNISRKYIVCNSALKDILFAYER